MVGWSPISGCGTNKVVVGWGRMDEQSSVGRMIGKMYDKVYRMAEQSSVERIKKVVVGRGSIS